MSKPRVMLYWKENGDFWWCASEGVEIVCVDSNCENDRVYVKQGDTPQEEFDAVVDRAIAGALDPRTDDT